MKTNNIRYILSKNHLNCAIRSYVLCNFVLKCSNKTLMFSFLFNIALASSSYSM